MAQRLSLDERARVEVMITAGVSVAEAARRFADSHCASQPRIRPGDTAASTANSPGLATASLRPRSGRS